MLAASFRLWLENREQQGQWHEGTVVTDGTTSNNVTDTDAGSNTTTATTRTNLRYYLLPEGVDDREATAEADATDDDDDENGPHTDAVDMDDRDYSHPLQSPTEGLTQSEPLYDDNSAGQAPQFSSAYEEGAGREELQDERPEAALAPATSGKGKRKHRRASIEKGA